MIGPLPRRGFSLLLVIVMVTLLSMAAVGLMTTTASRYHGAQLTRDRLQALQCAQAGLLWAHARSDTGSPPDGSLTLALGTAGTARITTTATRRGLRVEVIGTAVRHGIPQASRRLEVLWPQENSSR